MNLLSYLSFTAFIIFVLLGIYCLRLNPRQALNRFACYECLTLAVWAFAYTFLYTAPNPQTAMFWHQVGCIGGSLFPPFAIYFFLILSKREHLLSPLWLKIPFYGIPILLLIKSLGSGNTFLATGFVPSASGWGFTYVNSIDNVWTWIYAGYLGMTFVVGLYLLLLWGRESAYATQKKQAYTIVVIDTIVLIFGTATDIVLPLFTVYFPPMANLGTLLFALGFFYLVNDQQLFTFAKIASSDAILDTVMDPVLLLDDTGKIIRYNQATALVLNYDQSELLGKDLNFLLRTGQYNRDSIKKLLAEKKIDSLETELITSDGKNIYAILSAAVASDSIDGFMGIVVTFHDITQRKIAEIELRESRESYRQLADELYQLANYDALTQLPNRRMFFAQLRELSAHYPGSTGDFALIFLDLNEFKAINDRFGHTVGDQVLIQAARRLEAVNRDEMMTARMGGDEFTVIIPEVGSPDAVRAVIADIKAAFAAPLIIGDLHLRLSVSAGYSLFSQAGFNVDQLIRLADQGMYQDKKNSRPE